MHFYDHYLCLNRVCVLFGAGTVLNTGIFLNSADGWGQSDVLKQWEWTKTIKPCAVKLKLRCRRAPQSRNWTAESGNHFYIWSSVNIKLLIIAALRLGYKMCLPHIHHSVTQVKTVYLQQALCLQQEIGSSDVASAAVIRWWVVRTRSDLALPFSHLFRSTKLLADLVIGCEINEDVTSRRSRGFTSSAWVS